MEVVQGRPVLLHKGVEVGFFYPLHNYCEVRSTLGSAIIHRMMRGQRILAEWQDSFRGPFHTYLPQFLRCKACKLGCFARAEARHLRVECRHGAWIGKPPPRTDAATRIGVQVLPCSVCGLTFRPPYTAVEWTYLGENPSPQERFYADLHFCGSGCCDRARAWVLP